MDFNKKIGGGKMSLLALCLAGGALLMAALYLFMFLGEFWFASADLGSIGTLRGGAIGNELIFADDPVGGLLAAWILALVVVVLLIAALVLNFLKIDLPDIALPACFALNGLILLVVGILAFCTAAFVGGGGLGVAGVFAGIFGILGCGCSMGAAFFVFKK